MTDRARRARTTTFDHTITGLLTKRSDLAAEALEIRDRFAAIRNDLEAVDRILRSLGFEGDLEAAMPGMRRERLFGHNELTRTILDILREARAPLTSREIGRRALIAIGQDPNDRALVASYARRVSKAMRALRTDGVVAKEGDKPGRVVWSVAA